MRHQDLTINHRLESWVFANAAARNAAGTYVTADIGRISFQTDTGQYWRLTATTPTWVLIVPPVAAPVYAFLQTGQANPPITTALAPGVMLGLGVGNTITPSATGKILVTIAGTLGNAIANKTPGCQMRYGSGIPPSFGASGGANGSALGASAFVTGNIVNNASPFSLSAVISGATLGAPLWFDLALWNLTTGGQAYGVAVSITAVELP
jgi:hypothetical protein